MGLILSETDAPLPSAGLSERGPLKPEQPGKVDAVGASQGSLGDREEACYGA